jgi:hypothetical protein
MSLNDYEADALARLEDQLVDEDPDLALQFAVLQHPSLGGLPARPEASWGSRVFARLGVLGVVMSLPGILFGAWPVVGGLLLLGVIVGVLAAAGSWVADRGDRRRYPTFAPSRVSQLRRSSDAG